LSTSATDLPTPPSFPTRRSSDLIFDKIERIGNVDVGRLAVGQDDDKLAEAAGMADQLAGVTKRGTEPCRQAGRQCRQPADARTVDRKSTRLNSSHVSSSYAVFCL